MYTRNDDDYWPPRAGSWEEAVTPYDAQWTRPSGDDRQTESQELSVEALSERPSDRMSATF